MLKKILTEAKVYLVGTLGALLLYLLYRSIKWESVYITPEGKDVFDQPPKIIAFWHSRQLMIPPRYYRIPAPHKIPVYSLISMHTDGRMLAHGIKLLGVHSVAGSSSRGGKNASITLREKLEQGFSISITPDGPTGPMNQAKPGIIKIAHDTCAPIYPLSYSTDRYWQFKSWDKMILPKPFSRGVFVVGRPLTIKTQLDDQNIDSLTNEVNSHINEADTLADKYFL